MNGENSSLIPSATSTERPKRTRVAHIDLIFPDDTNLDKMSLFFNVTVFPPILEGDISAAEIFVTKMLAAIGVHPPEEPPETGRERRVN